MATCKGMRRLALLQHARGVSQKPAVPQAKHFQARSSLKLLSDLESHVTASGKELFASLKDLIFLEKEALLKEVAHQKELLAKEKEAKEKERELNAKEKEAQEFLKEHRTRDRLDLLRLKGINDTRGLLERMQEVLATNVGTPHKKGSSLWEAILNAHPTLCVCIQKCTGIKDVARQAAHCHTIYSVLSQHIHTGKELANLQAAKGKILFHRGPLSPEQVRIYLCIGQAANFDIAEDQV